MKRREFIGLLSGAAAASSVSWPLTARAQQSIPVVGVLHPTSPDRTVARTSAFRKGLSEAGYVEGRNVAIENRWAEGRNDLLPAMAVELVRRPVKVLFATGIPAVQAAKAATATIPIVFQGGFDPVALGIVASLNRPGGNITGVSSLSIELGPKRLELLHELVPKATVIGLLVNPDNPTSEAQLKSLQAPARMFGLELQVLHAKSGREIDTVFSSLAQRRIGALVISNDGVFIGQLEQLGVLAARHAMPTIFQFREFVAAGGLMSYGASLTEGFRLAGAYVGRILKGDKPADLPVQQLMRIELAINLKAANALGLTVPLPLLGRADEVIE
jgi:putative tryptophan/tyrosine transport system substrate-binding protein